MSVYLFEEYLSYAPTKSTKLALYEDPYGARRPPPAEKWVLFGEP